MRRILAVALLVGGLVIATGAQENTGSASSTPSARTVRNESVGVGITRSSSRRTIDGREKAGSDNVRLWSREATSPDYRPTLTLTYTTP